MRALTASLVLNVTAKDYRAEVEKVFDFVRDNVRYTQDINDVETIQYPVNTLEFGYGDCDDMATLLASMLESIGHPCRFAAVGTVAGEFEHVLIQTLIGTSWVALDPTEDHPMGWAPPGIAGYLIRFI